MFNPKRPTLPSFVFVGRDFLGRSAMKINAGGAPICIEGPQQKSSLLLRRYSHVAPCPCSGTNKVHYYDCSWQESYVFYLNDDTSDFLVFSHRALR
jgi:hypothetical protein